MVTLNSRSMSVTAMSRVHSARSNCNRRGSALVINANSFRCWVSVSFGGRPGMGLAFSAGNPPAR